MKNFYESLRDIERSVTCRHYAPSGTEIHFHQSLEIIYVDRNNLNITIGEKNYRIEANSLICIPPFYPHSIEFLDQNSYYALIISPPFLKDFNDEHTDGGPILYSDESLTLLPIIQSLQSLPKSKTLLQGMVNTVLGNILCDGYKSTEKSKNHSFIISVINYVSEHYKEEISLENISAYFGYSKYHFSRLFNKNFNCSLRAYINRIRLENIENANKSMPVMQAIYENGFNTPSSYYRTAKRLSTKN